MFSFKKSLNPNQKFEMSERDKNTLKSGLVWSAVWFRAEVRNRYN